MQSVSLCSAQRRSESSFEVERLKRWHHSAEWCSVHAIEARLLKQRLTLPTLSARQFFLDVWNMHNHRRLRTGLGVGKHKVLSQHGRRVLLPRVELTGWGRGFILRWGAGVEGCAWPGGGPQLPRLCIGIHVQAKSNECKCTALLARACKKNAVMMVYVQWWRRWPLLPNHNPPTLATSLEKVELAPDVRG